MPAMRRRAAAMTAVRHSGKNALRENSNAKTGERGQVRVRVKAHEKVQERMHTKDRANVRVASAYLRASWAS